MGSSELIIVNESGLSPVRGSNFSSVRDYQTGGVPQGLIPEPLLFQVSMYADDTEMLGRLSRFQST